MCAYMSGSKSKKFHSLSKTLNLYCARFRSTALNFSCLSLFRNIRTLLLSRALRKVVCGSCVKLKILPLGLGIVDSNPSSLNEPPLFMLEEVFVVSMNQFGTEGGFGVLEKLI